MYLTDFTLPIYEEENIIQGVASSNGGKYGYIDNPYPCGLFKDKGLEQLIFDKITVIYGGNGSGKSTLLNIIAKKLELNRVSPYNTSETFDAYVERCSFSLGYDDEGFKHRIPNGSRIITSDDVFDYMLTVRTNNDEISEGKLIAKEKYNSTKRDLFLGKSIQFGGMDDYEAFRDLLLIRSKSVSRREYIRRVAGKEVKMNSNGETALEYFDSKLKNDTLYCLDEPENSLSPSMQLKLKGIIEEMARYCGCQFVIATHSPFLLAMKNAKIYDLDSEKVCVKNWWELENTRIYFDFFNENRELFL